MIDRRMFVGGAMALVGCAPAVAPAGAAADPIAEGLRRIAESAGAGNRVGVQILDTGTGRRWGHLADARFAMASTFKMSLAAFVLAEAEAGRLSLTDEIAFAQADMVSHAPVTSAHLAAGRLSVERLCAAIVEVSDNPAANLLMRRTGGPEALTAFWRSVGDQVTRLDRWELALNENLPGDPRDTTSPAAMVETMRVLLLGDRLSATSKARLIGWMETSTTGRERIRAGLPAGWRAGDKTGTGARGSHNDIAIVRPPSRAPVLVAAYLDAPGLQPAQCNAIHAAIGRLVAGIGS